MLSDNQINKIVSMIFFGKTDDEINSDFIKKNFDEIFKQMYPSARVELMKMINDKKFVAERVINSKDIGIRDREEMIEEMTKVYDFSEEERIEILANFFSANKDDVTSLDKVRMIFFECLQESNGESEHSFNRQKFHKIINHPLIQLEKKEEAQIALATHDPQQIIQTFSKFDGIIRSKHLENVSREDLFNSIANIINKREELGLEYVENHLLKLAKMAKEYKKEESNLDDAAYRFFLRDVLYDDRNTDLLLGKKFDEITIPLILSSNDEILIKEIIKGNPCFNIYGFQCVNLLEKYGNEELIKSVLEGKTDAKLDYQDRGKLSVFLIENDLEKYGADPNNLEETRVVAYENFLSNPELELSESDFCFVIASSKSPELIKKVIESKRIKVEYEVVELLCALDDKEYLRSYLDNHQGEMDINHVESLIYKMGDKERIHQFEQNIHVIKNISELSLEDLKKLSDDATIRIENDSNSAVQQCLYSKKEFVAIKERIHEMLDGIEPARVGDKESELMTFLKVYKRLSENIIYDQYAVSEEGEKDRDLEVSCRTLKCLNQPGDMVKCVCAGYADILANALSEKGIEARYIQGYPVKGRGSGHAWNQVKIGGQWFNVDLTWDRREVASKNVLTFDVLKTDEEFKDHEEFGRSRTEQHECLEPASRVFSDIDDVEVSKHKVDVGVSVRKLGRRFHIGYHELVQKAKELKDRIIKGKNREVPNQEKD